MHNRRKNSTLKINLNNYIINNFDKALKEKNTVFFITAFEILKKIEFQIKYVNLSYDDESSFWKIM
jgi:hypothetical protein